MASIYYCIRTKPTAGGQFVNAEHVAALRELGLRAYLLYIPSANGIERFSAGSAAMLLYSDHQTFRHDDVVVVPEPWKPGLEYFSRQVCQKVMHCQNAFYLFHGFDDVQSIGAAGYQHMLSCSEYTTKAVKGFGYAYPIHTVRPFVPKDFFDTQKARRLQIAYMPRKRANELVFVRGLFRSLYPQFNQIEWVSIQDVTREECAALLQQSAIFAAFSFTEGLGLPPLEAMAAGCVIVGFHGLGGLDYANAYNGLWVEEGDYESYAHQLAKAIALYHSDNRLSLYREHCQKTLLNYSYNQFSQSLKTSWQAILGERYHEFLLDSD